MGSHELPELEPALRARVLGILGPRGVPGAAIGVVRDGELAAFDGLGVADLSSGATITPHTLFRVASITKTVTATAIMQLRDGGKLDLDDPLVRHLPEFGAVRARRGSVEQVTFRRLLAHHSGLIGDPLGDCWDKNEFPSPSQILSDLPQTEVVLEPDRAYKYSNLGYALMGEVIARLTGRDCLDYLREAILEPLGMASSVFELTDSLRPRLATGYDAVSNEDRLEPMPATSIHGLAAAGQMYSCVHDLARWIGFQLQVGPAAEAGRGILDPATLEEMRRPQFLEPDWSTGYCLPWLAKRRGDLIHHGHTGSLPGYRSAHYFNKPAKLGVVVLANLGWLEEVPETALTLLDALVAEASEQEPALATAEAAVPPADWRPLLGLYACRAVATVRIAFRAGELRLERADPASSPLHSPATLRPTDDPLVFEVEGGLGTGEYARFRTDARSDVVGFALGAWVYRKLAAAEG